MLRPCNRSDCTTVTIRSTKRHPVALWQPNTSSATTRRGAALATKRFPPPQHGATLHPLGVVVGRFDPIDRGEQPEHGFAGQEPLAMACKSGVAAVHPLKQEFAQRDDVRLQPRLQLVPGAAPRPGTGATIRTPPFALPHWGRPSSWPSRPVWIVGSGSSGPAAAGNALSHLVQRSGRWTMTSWTRSRGSHSLRCGLWLGYVPRFLPVGFLAGAGGCGATGRLGGGGWSFSWRSRSLLSSSRMRASSW